MAGKYPSRIVVHFAKLKIREMLRPGSFLSEENILPDPMSQFEKWFKAAKRKRLRFYEAMTLSTADISGVPSARVVLLKNYGSNGFIFFTNSNSKKGRVLEENQHAALTFFWGVMGRQVCIGGKAYLIPGCEADEYFATRPHSSKISAWASDQSSVIENRKVLEREVEGYKEKFTGEVVPRPPFWNGYCLVPEQIEFWENRANRLHDRFLYKQKGNGGWEICRLSP